MSKETLFSFQFRDHSLQTNIGGNETKKYKCIKLAHFTHLIIFEGPHKISIFIFCMKLQFFNETASISCIISANEKKIDLEILKACPFYAGKTGNKVSKIRLVLKD